MTCTLRVTASAPDMAQVSVRRHQFAVGRPLELDETAPRVAAVEYALGAVGAEVVNGLRVFAWRRRIEIDQIEAVVTGELEREASYLEMVGESGPPRIGRIHVKVFMTAPDEASVRKLWSDTCDRLPLVSTMRSACSVDLELTMTV